MKQSEAENASETLSLLCSTDNVSVLIRLRDGSQFFATVVEPVSRDSRVVVRPFGCALALSLDLQAIKSASVARAMRWENAVAIGRENRARFESKIETTR